MMETSEPFVKSWNDRIVLAREQGIGAVVEPTLARWLTPAFVAAETAAACRISTCPPCSSRAPRSKVLRISPASSSPKPVAGRWPTLLPVSLHAEHGDQGRLSGEIPCAASVSAFTRTVTYLIPNFGPFPTPRKEAAACRAEFARQIMFFDHGSPENKAVTRRIVATVTVSTVLSRRYQSGSRLRRIA